MVLLSLLKQGEIDKFRKLRANLVKSLRTGVIRWRTDLIRRRTGLIRWRTGLIRRQTGLIRARIKPVRWRILC